VPELDSLTLNITQETHIDAPMEVAFDALLEEMGPFNQTPDGAAMPMVVEARPGGRWFRDLGGENGHLWGHVQAIRRPALMEITGPLFISAPVISNIQYRLKESNGGTLITVRHTALGLLPDGLKEGVHRGWIHLLDRTKLRAQGK
jgi:uncharacterized protein YndB with AHSA1/START domain